MKAGEDKTISRGEKKIKGQNSVRIRTTHHLTRLLARRGIVFAELFLLLLGMACRKENSIEPKKENIIRNNLVFTRQDESVIEMGEEYAICCGIWEPGTIDKNTLKIMVYDPAQQKSGWKLFILPEIAVANTSYQLPTPPAGESAVSVFIWDAPQHNELNSEQGESSGSITIHSLSCGTPLQISLEIDAWLASELGGAPPVHVSGTFECTIYQNPSPLGCDFGF